MSLSVCVCVCVCVSEVILLSLQHSKHLKQDVLRELQCLRGVFWKFQGCFKEVSRMFQGNFKGVNGKFQGCFKEVSRVFQESFKSVSKRFQ